MTARIAVIIPTLNEAEAIGGVIAEIPRPPVDEIIVADSGSRDGTGPIAEAAGAKLVTLAARGYGRACAAGAAATAADILVFMDGDGADRADLLPILVGPLLAGDADFVLAARHKAGRAAGAMSLHQVVAGHVLGRGIQLLTGQKYTDMCAFRAITRRAYERLGMSEMTYGWNIEMQMQAARLKLRVLEVPLPYRVRTGGTSKVAGSLQGTVKASWRILATFIRLARRG